MQLQQWFNNTLTIDFLNIFKYNKDLASKYSLVLSTETKFVQQHPNVILIDLFPTENDRLKIKSALTKNVKAEEILNFFDPSLFFCGNVKNKDELLKILCAKVEKICPTNNQLIKSVLIHEKKLILILEINLLCHTLMNN